MCMPVFRFPLQLYFPSSKDTSYFIQLASIQFHHDLILTKYIHNGSISKDDHMLTLTYKFWWT